MNIPVICSLCLVCAIMALTLRKYNPEIAMLISLGAGVIIAGLIIARAAPIADKMSALLSAAKMNGEYSSVLFKSLGICFICQFASDSCNDEGERALASKIELAGKISVVVLSLPLLEKIIQTALDLLQR